jgi:hypothetical protein
MHDAFYTLVCPQDSVEISYGACQCSTLLQTLLEDDPNGTTVMVDSFDSALLRRIVTLLEALADKSLSLASFDDKEDLVKIIMAADFLDCQPLLTCAFEALEARYDARTWVSPLHKDRAAKLVQEHDWLFK